MGLWNRIKDAKNVDILHLNWRLGRQVWKRSELLDSTEPATKHEEIQPQDGSKRSGRFHEIWIRTVYVYIYNMYRDLYKFPGIGSEYALFGWIYLHLFTIGWLVLGCKLIQAHPVLSGLFPIYNCPKGKGEEGSSTSGYVKCAKHRHPEHTNITNFISPLITSVFFL